MVALTTRSKTLHKSSVVLAAGVDTLLYTVPAGRRTIIRSFVMYHGGAAPQTIEERTGAGANATIRSVTLTQGQTNTYETWRVLETGQGIWLRSAAAVTITVWISGAELVV